MSIWKVNFSCETFADFCYDHGVEKFHRLPCVCKFQVLSLFFATIKGNTRQCNNNYNNSNNNNNNNNNNNKKDKTLPSH